MGIFSRIQELKAEHRHSRIARMEEQTERANAELKVIEPHAEAQRKLAEARVTMERAREINSPVRRFLRRVKPMAARIQKNQKARLKRQNKPNPFTKKTRGGGFKF